MAANPLESVVAPVASPVAPTAANENQPALFKKAGGDWAKADQSYFNIVNENKQTRLTNEQLAARNQQLESVVATLTNGNGGQPANADPFEVMQNELGLPADPLRRAVNFEVERVLTSILSPLTAQVAADEALSGEIDNFEQLKGEARKFMKEHPDTAATFEAVRAAGKPVEAWKYAIRETAIASQGASRPGAVHAGLTGGGASPGRGPEHVGPDQAAREAAALEYSQKFGDSSHYRHERFQGTSIAAAIRDGLQKLGYMPPDGSSNTGW